MTKSLCGRNRGFGERTTEETGFQTFPKMVGADRFDDADMTFCGKVLYSNIY